MISPGIKKKALFAFFIISTFLGRDAFAQISTLSAWSNQYHNTSTATQNVTYTITYRE